MYLAPFSKGIGRGGAVMARSLEITILLKDNLIEALFIKYLRILHVLHVEPFIKFGPSEERAF